MLDYHVQILFLIYLTDQKQSFTTYQIHWNSNNSSHFLSSIFNNDQFILSHILARNINTKSFRKLFKDLYLLSEFIELNLNLICHFHNKNKDIPIKEVLFNTTINQRHFHDPFYSIIIDQNIIFGQNLVKKTKNTNLFLKMNL